MNLARKAASRPAHVLHSISRNAGSVLVHPVLFNAFKRLASGASASEKADLFADTASRFYRLVR